MEKRKEHKIISSAAIKTGPYQRPIRMQWVREIIKRWDPLKADAPKVSFRDGRYWIFDGQHTLMARLAKNDMKPVKVECEVYYGLTLEDEASMFVALNTDRKCVNVNERAKGLLIAGDEEIKRLVSIVEGCGYELSYTRAIGGGKIGAISKLTNILRSGGEEALRWVLDVITKAWPDDALAVKASILGGLAKIYEAYGKDTTFSTKRFIEKMRIVTPATIIREGRELIAGGDARFAKRMAYHYNKGMRVNKLDMSKLD